MHRALRLLAVGILAFTVGPYSITATPADLGPCEALKGATPRFLDYARRENEILGIGTHSPRYGQPVMEVLIEPASDKETLLRFFTPTDVGAPVEVVRPSTSLWNEASGRTIEVERGARTLPKDLGRTLIELLDREVGNARFPAEGFVPCLDGTRYTFRASGIRCGSIACPATGSRGASLLRLVHSVVGYVVEQDESEVSRARGRIEQMLRELAGSDSGAPRS